MSSIIVLDSSDEDESPPKKANVKSPTDSNYNASVTSSRGQNAKQRAIPSGITITPRLSPTALGAKSVNMQSLNTSSLAASFVALNSIINDERQTPTPPKAPQAPGLNQRKRKTPTPPQSMQRLTAKNFATMTNSSPAKAATTVAPLPPIMPMITGVHSMAAAGATPPLQLMATPPHNLGAFMGLNEQLMINPHLISSGLPPNTTITAHPNPNQNNINNNFKIHLPFNKPSTTTTPSPAASPASSAPKTPSPQLTPSPQPGRADRNSRRIKPTTLLKSSDESWQRHKQYNTQNDKQSQRTPVSLSNDVVIEMLPPSTESPKSISASSSRHHTPMTSPTTPKSRKSPDVIILTTPTDRNIHKDCETVLDLTHSPDKVKNTTATSIKPTEIVDLVNTPERQINGDANNTKADKKPDKPPPKPPLEPEYEELIKACRKADPSKDMEKLIKSRLIKYYYEVHSDFVKSKSFRKSILKVVESIKAKPDLVYLNLKTVVEELKVRRKARLVEEATAGAATNTATTTTTSAAATTNNSAESPATEKSAGENSGKNTTTSESNVPSTSTSTTAANISAMATASTGNKKLDEQIKKLNKALYVLTKRIEVLEQAEVDWDDDDSSFLQVERFKKRACQIYEKICDLTGESKNAHRLVKKPIKFNETRIPQFNKTLQAFINRTKEFPDYFDVLRMLEHCNRTYSLGLVNFEMKNIAEDAFIKVGKLLQSRRKADLYETVTHYAGDGTDPAKTDPALAAKLNENLKNHKKINDILEKFARKQDMPDVEEEEEKAEKTEDTTLETEAKADAEVSVKLETETSETTATTTPEISNIENQKVDEDKKPVLIKSEESKNETETTGQDKMVVDDEEDDDEDDDEDEDEEDDENLDEQVETLANGDVSDNESDNEIDKPTNNQNADKQNESLVSLNSDSIEIVDKTLDTTNEDQSLTECIEIHDNSHEILRPDVTMKNCMAKEAAIIKINSDTDSILICNNNNDLEVTKTKTAINTITTTTTITDECSLPSSPLSSPIPPASITPTRNGKLKDTPPPHHLLNNNSNATNLCTATATVTTTTTTTTADLKIVHVSSLEPDSNNTVIIVDNDNVPALINRSEVVSNLCTDLTSPASASKSLEEIVISDEES